MHELVQATVLSNDVSARTKHQVKRIAEKDLRTTFSNFFRRNALDRSVGAHWHESGCLNRSSSKR